MSDEIYLTITGEQQGCISSRCGTSASIGNRRQISMKMKSSRSRYLIVLRIQAKGHNYMALVSVS